MSSTTTTPPPSSTHRTSITSWRLPFGDEATGISPDPDDDPFTPHFSASIITLAPSTTAFVLTCHPGCHNWAPTITIGGHWAEITSSSVPAGDNATITAPAAGTGTFDFHLTSLDRGPVTFTDTFEHSTATPTITLGGPQTTTMSYHCDIYSTSSVGVCTESLDAEPATYRNGMYTFTGGGAPDWGMTDVPVTITAGIGMEAVTATPTHNDAAAVAAVPVTGGLGGLGLMGLVASLFI